MKINEIYVCKEIRKQGIFSQVKTKMLDYPKPGDETPESCIVTVYYG